MKISLTKKTNQSKIERYIRGKQAWFWQLKLYSDSFRRFWRTYGLQVSRKTVAKSLKTLAACDSRRLCMRRITYDSAAVNISVFIEQRNISFQNDISLKNHETGSLVVWKVKTSWDSRQNRKLGPASLGSRKAIADLFGVMFIAWTSQKASKTHKLLSQSWP